MDIYYIHIIHTYPTLPFKQIDRPQVLYEETIMSFLVQQILGHFWTLVMDTGLVPTSPLVSLKSGHIQ